MSTKKLIVCGAPWELNCELCPSVLIYILIYLIAPATNVGYIICILPDISATAAPGVLIYVLVYPIA
jgi:hypothetical protein